MIGQLPTSLNVGGVNYPIRSDYRPALVILQAFADPDLTDMDKAIIAIECLYEDSDNIPSEYIQEAVDKAIWFLDCGTSNEEPNTGNKPRLYDFEQDEQIIFSAINKVAGQEVRALEYMHFWTFIGLFNEIGEGTFQTIVSIRSKLAKHQKLDKWEREYYRNNLSTVKLKRKYSESEQEALNQLDRLLKGV